MNNKIEMIPATDEDLKNIERDFQQFRKLGDTDLKAAYKAITNRGFQDMISTSDCASAVLMYRQMDKKYVVFSFNLKREPSPVISSALPPVVKFHVDKSCFKDAGAV